MTSALAPARRTTAGLTAKGLVVVYAAKLRDAAAEMSERECAELAAELRDLVETYCPRRPSPAA